jgi:hypothetical protein
MLLKRGPDKRKTIVMLAIVILGIIGVWFFLTPGGLSVNNFLGDKTKVLVPQDSKTVLDSKSNTIADTKDKTIVKGEIILKPTIDFKDLKKNDSLGKLMDTRKEDMGIQKSLDMIIKSDESFIVGGSKVTMREILEKAFTKSGTVYQEEISPSGASVPVQIKAYGIHVVRPGDNIWNIHFDILKEYYAHKNISISPKADEPGNLGLSSGVGKVLKFSETMVIIYNLIERRVVKDINLIEPLSKIVVYNMDAVFSLLKEINYENVDRIQFDGKNIWIPAKKS